MKHLISTSLPVNGILFNEVGAAVVTIINYNTIKEEKKNFLLCRFN